MLKKRYRLLMGFAAAAAVVLSLLGAPLHAQSDADPLPATYADPAVPMLQLPTGFRARRTSANLAMEAGKPVEILNATGAGCVRHLWFVFGEKDISGREKL
jgi:hypothetical protein